MPQGAEMDSLLQVLVFVDPAVCGFLAVVGNLAQLFPIGLYGLDLMLQLVLPPERPALVVVKPGFCIVILPLPGAVHQGFPDCCGFLDLQRNYITLPLKGLHLFRRIGVATTPLNKAFVGGLLLQVGGGIQKELPPIQQTVNFVQFRLQIPLQISGLLYQIMELLEVFTAVIASGFLDLSGNRPLWYPRPFAHSSGGAPGSIGYTSFSQALFSGRPGVPDVLR